MCNSITLIGMAGAGKTSVGKVLSSRLDKRFIDSDHEIERELSMTLQEILFKKGKDEFLEIISKYFTLTNLQTDWESLKKADDELLINSLSILCPFENDEKQALLEAKTIKERVKILTTLMEMSIKAETTFGPLQ